MATPVVTVDPWLEEGVSLGNYNSSYFEELNQTLSEQEPVVEPDVPGEPKLVEEIPPAPVEPVVQSEPEPDHQPRVTQFEDGSSLTVENTNKGWKATLDPNIAGVNPEVFYGKTKDELYTRIAAGKVNATKKIRELNKTVKLGSAAPTPASKPVSSRAYVRDLTPDEVFEFKTLYESNPVQALDYYNEKRYGLKPNDFARKLNEGTMARQLGEIESVARTFVQNNPDYYPTQSNLSVVIRYLVRKTFGRALTPDEDFDQLTIDLLENGAWTVENLEAAKDDLMASELLEMAPKQPAKTPQPITVAPVPPAAPVAVQPPAAPVNEPPIAPQPTVRTRAGNLGIRVTETRNPVTAEPPPPAEDVNQWSDDAVEEALKVYRRNRAIQR